MFGGNVIHDGQMNVQVLEVGLTGEESLGTELTDQLEHVEFLG